MTMQTTSQLLCEMMVCPNCQEHGDGIRELDRPTRTWICTNCGWTGDGADFDPGFDDNLEVGTADLLTADISAVPEKGLDHPANKTTQWTGTVDGKAVTVYCDDSHQAQYLALLWAHNQGYDITLEQWSRFDPTVFTIPDANLPNLVARIDKMNLKAVKLDVPEIEFTRLGHLVEKRALSESDRIAGTKHVVHCTVVRVTGQRIKLDGGWTFVGTLEHSEAGNILRAVPDETIPETYRNVSPTCDHCQLDRNRKDTYIVRDAAGTYQQVGRTCLKDFLGHRNPALVAAYLEHLAELGAALDNDDYWAGDTKASGYGAEYFLGMVAGAIRLWGWTPRSKRTDYNAATADITSAWIEDASMALMDNNGLPSKHGGVALTPNGERIETCEADFATGRAALAWCQALTEDKLTNDYLWNLFVVASVEHFTYRQLGLAASMIPAYQRHLADTLERLDKPESHFLGTIKKRTVWTDLLCTDIISWEGFYGVTHLHKFQDTDGNILIWKTGKLLDQGCTYTGKATVKSHEIYRDIKQTVLTRAAFQEQEK